MRIKSLIGNIVLSGLLDNKHSPLYFPEGALRMRIAGQMILTKTMEIAMLGGGRVISANTDGIEVIIPRGTFEQYCDRMKVAEEMFGIELEHNKYTKVVYKNVNNYIAITDKGKVKKKGIFKYGDDIPLGDSVNEQVIPKALEKYFVEGIPVEETIRHPWKYGIHIYDYCVSKKVDRTFTVMYAGEVQQRLNRYYFSKGGAYLYKVKNGNVMHMHKDSGVRLFNKFEERSWEEYDINYAYYTHKANTIIAELENTIRQSTLF